MKPKEFEKLLNVLNMEKDVFEKKLTLKFSYGISIELQ